MCKPDIVHCNQFVYMPRRSPVMEDAVQTALVRCYAVPNQALDAAMWYYHQQAIIAVRSSLSARASAVLVQCLEQLAACQMLSEILTFKVPLKFRGTGLGVRVSC